VRDAAGRERDRALLAEGRRQLERLRAEALGRLAAEVTEADLERLVREVLGEAGPVESVLVVDPGSEEAARRVVAAIAPAVVPEIRAAAARRGGVELVTGTLVLDDTVAGRLERAWPRAEPELASILFAGEGG
jgi:vacuolar-type H+-ATPase subunit E/Vma4